MAAQKSTAHRTFITTLVALSVVVGAVALWELRVVVALFLGVRGGFYVLLTIPIASIVATLIDVTVRGINPADVETPVVLFPSQDAEA